MNEETWKIKPVNKLRGLSTVLVDKSDILLTIRDNRENHRTKFEEAMAGYKDRAIELLVDHIDSIKRNDPEEIYVSLPFPEDHTDDYDRVISQLEYSLDEQLELTSQEFDTYILDQWGWQTSFGETYTMYTGS